MFELYLAPSCRWLCGFSSPLCVVLVLIGATAWLVRRFGADRLGAAATRGRQPRLAVIDAAAVDARRRLVLIRRDNVEHLIMIGGPTDIVVEQNIVRAVAAARDTPRPAAPASESPPRGSAGGHDPVAAAARTRSRHARRAPAATRRSAVRTGSAPAPRPSAAGGSADAGPTLRRPRRRSVARPAADAQNPPAERALRTAERRSPCGRPRPAAASAGRGPRGRQRPTRISADMAQRLEAALRRPTASARQAGGRGRLRNAKTATVVCRSRRARSFRSRRPRRTKPARRGGRNAAEPKPGKAVYDSLEQEMASLLGRPQLGTVTARALAGLCSSRRRRRWRSLWPYILRQRRTSASISARAPA